jgi:putative transposase
VHQERQWYRVDELCHALRISRGGYYAWLRTEMKRRREPSDEMLLADIRQIYEDSGQAYGSPRVYRELREADRKCSKARVERLMRQNGLRAKHKRKFKVTTDSAHHLPVADNILAGRFNWENPDQAWVGDITYIGTDEGWLYLAVLIDLCSRKIVGWSMDKRMTRELPLKALRMAVQRRKPGLGLIHHTDRGSQYASKDYQDALRRYGMVCSMSAKGRCYDNAVAESFFHSLKVELIHGQRFASRERAMSAIFKYVEVFFNTKRRHSSLDYMTPVAYEQRRALLKAA